MIQHVSVLEPGLIFIITTSGYSIGQKAHTHTVVNKHKKQKWSNQPCIQDGGTGAKSGQQTCSKAAWDLNRDRRHHNLYSISTEGTQRLILLPQIYILALSASRTNKALVAALVQIPAAAALSAFSVITESVIGIRYVMIRLLVTFVNYIVVFSSILWNIK